jgi:beta-mannosidase
VPDPQTGAVAVHVTNDHLAEMAGVVVWEVTTVSGEQVAGGEEAAVIGPNQNTPVATLDLQHLLAEYGGRNLLVWLSLQVEDQTVSRNLALFARPKHLPLADPQINWQVEQSGPCTYQVTLSAGNPALWVWLEIEGLDIQLSDNFFHLYPGQEYTISLTTNPANLAQSTILKAITVRSLYDTYQN